MSNCLSNFWRYGVIAMLVVAIGSTGVSATAGEPRPEDQAQSPADAVKSVLIVTGEDIHAWQQTTPVLRRQLERDARLKVDVLDDLAKLSEIDLTRYRAVVVHFKNYHAETPGRAGFDNLKRFVDRGGGLVLVHFACGAFEEFKDEFEKLAGRVWFGLPAPQGHHQHDPYGQFTVHMNDGAHPITKGISDFETRDELYTCLEGETPIRVLATATSKVDGKSYPLIFVLEPEKGRVFHCALGHDVESLSQPTVGELYRRGTAWVCGLEVIRNE